MKQANQKTTKSFKQPKYYVAGVLGLLIVIVFGWWAGKYYLQNRPDVIMADALANSAKSLTNTSPLQRDITVIYQPSEGQKGIPVTVALSGISHEGSYSGQATLATAVLGQNIMLDGNFIVVDGEYYVQPKDVEGSLKKTAAANPLLTSYISYATEIAKKYEGVWIKVAPDKGGDKVSSECSDALASVTLSEEDVTKMRELYLKEPIFTDVTKVGAETINDQPSYHLRATVSQPPYSAFNKKLLQLTSLRSLTSKCSSKPQELPSNIEASVDVWVSKETREFTKIQYAQKRGVTSVELSSRPTTTIPGTTSKPESSVTLEQFKTDLESIIGTVL